MSAGAGALIGALIGVLASPSEQRVEGGLIGALLGACVGGGDLDVRRTARAIDVAWREVKA